jgi:hypothetical protein
MIETPRFIGRRTAAELVSTRFFPVSARTIQRWPLATRRIHGRALLDREEVFAYAETIIRSAPAVKQAGRN